MSYVIDVSCIDCEKIKSIWGFASGAKILDITPFGDFFVQIDDDIFLYSLTDGEISNVSDAIAEHGLPPVEIALGDEWYQLDAQSMLKEDGLTLGPDQCFGFKDLVFKGGEYGPHNIEIVDLYDYHQRVCSAMT